MEPPVHPPLPPDYKSAKWDPASKCLESLVLATVHMWTQKYDRKIVAGHMVRCFTEAEVYQAMWELCTSVGKEKPQQGHGDTGERSAVELYAAELVDLLVNLVSAKKLPKIVISSMCLSLVPTATLKTSDDLSVSARLEGLELGMKKVTEALGKLHQLPLLQCQVGRVQ